MVSLVMIFIFPSEAQAGSIRDNEWLLAALNVASAHEITQGKSVTVAVIDTGVNNTHSDLLGSVLPGIDFAGNSSIADTNGHGTSMAGLIVGHGHGSGRREGILGVAPAAHIMPVRISVSGFPTTPNLAKGINWATAHGAKIICIASSGSSGTPQLQQAIADALNADIVIVAAAGNLPGARSVAYPAAYPGVVAAAGTDEHGRHAAVSVTGPQVVLSAPATNIVSTYKDGGYGIGTGTSNSTAIIAGAAALVRAKFPHLSATEVIHRLTATAIDKGAPGRDDEYGYGIVNLVGALTAIVPPLSPSSGAPDRSTSPSISAAGPHHGTAPWLPFAIAGIALLATLAIWISLRRTRQAT